eukprot:571185-Prymnesium_polylepis.1
MSRASVVELEEFTPEQMAPSVQAWAGAIAMTKSARSSSGRRDIGLLNCAGPWGLRRRGEGSAPFWRSGSRIGARPAILGWLGTAASDSSADHLAANALQRA